MPCRRRQTGSAPGRGGESAVRAVGVGQRTILRMRAKKAGTSRPACRQPCECKSAATRPAKVRGMPPCRKCAKKAGANRPAGYAPYMVSAQTLRRGKRRQHFLRNRASSLLKKVLRVRHTCRRIRIKPGRVLALSSSFGSYLTSGRGDCGHSRLLTPCLSRPPAPSLSNCPPARPSAHCPRGRLRPPRPSFRARSCVSGASARRRR